MCTSITQCTSNISSRKKIDFSSIPASPTPSSPILNTRRKNNTAVLNTGNINTSPILNSRKKGEIYSPVLHTNKFKKERILKSNIKSNCVRKLQYESESNDVESNVNSGISNKKFKLNFNSEHTKDVMQDKSINDWSKLKTNNSFNEYNFKKRKRKYTPRNKSYSKKIKTCEDIVIETVCSQELQNENENSIIGKLKSPSNILNSRYIEETNIELMCSQKEIETTEIEIINSQEIAKSSEIFAKIENISQNSGNDKMIIEEINSQSSSALSNISNCTVVPDSLEKSSDEYIWSPVKKKKYKPGTYSHKFQRILRKQKANTAIWKHELYLAKSTNYVIPASEEDSLITIVEICKINSDYGMNVLECVELKNNEKCLVIADLNQLFDDVVLKIKDKIKMFPPFSIDHLKIDECVIKTFINVHKILKC